MAGQAAPARARRAPWATPGRADARGGLPGGSRRLIVRRLD
jgi:hypothetical protein